MTPELARLLYIGLRTSKGRGDNPFGHRDYGKLLPSNLEGHVLVALPDPGTGRVFSLALEEGQG